MVGRIRNGQMKIQQMAFMLIAVTLFFVLVGMFVLMIQFSSIKDSASLLREKNSLLLVTSLANSPEFSCGDSYGRGSLRCIDAEKVMVLKKNIERYEGFWDVQNIEIRKIYPYDNRTCTADNYPDCGVIRLREGPTNSSYDNFVSLCRKENTEGYPENKCELAKLIVGYDNLIG